MKVKGAGDCSFCFCSSYEKFEDLFICLLGITRIMR